MDGEDELWDDGMIIDAYNRTMATVNQRVESLMNAAKATPNRNQDQNQAQNQEDKPEETANDPASRSSSLSALPRSSSTSQILAVDVPLVEQLSTKISQAAKQREDRWKEGDHCQAIYEEDGKPYEAIIVAIQNESSTCRIRYLSYENEETKRLDELRPSAGKAARQEQERNYLADKLYGLGDTTSESEADEFASNKAQASNRSYPAVAPDVHQMFSPAQLSASGRPGGKASNFLIPPPPTSLPPVPSIDENELLTTALMSWYMSGYHTGYYQAIRDLKRSNN